MLKFYATTFSTFGAIYYGARTFGVSNNYLAIAFLATTAISTAFSYFAPDFFCTIYNTSIDKNLSDRVHTLIDGNKELIKLNKDNLKIYLYESPDMNAFACGLSKNKSGIFVSSALYNSFIENPKLLDAVLAHEIGHICGSHNQISIALSSTIRLASIIKDTAWYSSNSKNNKGENRIKYFLVYLGLWIVEHFALSCISRQLEYDADRFAVKCGYGADLINALNIIHPDHYKRNNISSAYIWLTECFSSHPTLINRALAIEFAAKSENYGTFKYAKEYIKHSLNEWTSAFTEERSASDIVAAMAA